MSLQELILEDEYGIWKLWPEDSLLKKLHNIVCWFVFFADVCFHSLCY